MKLLYELAEINYSKMLSFSLSNEPLADRIIIRRLEQARKLLPKANLLVNTNGDYLTREYLEALRMAGLSSLKIQQYFEKKEQFSKEAVFAKINKTAAKLGLEYVVSSPRLYYGQWYEVRFLYEGMKIISYGRDFDENGHHRGGLIDIGPKRPRSAPCLYPFRDFSVHYDGSVTPCCNLRPDAPEHKKHIVGNIGNKTIFEIYAASDMVNWRKQLFNYAPKKTDVCVNCDFETEQYDGFTQKDYFEKYARFKCINNEKEIAL